MSENSSKRLFFIKGFTLIEITAVVLILGLTTTIIVTSVNYSIRRSRERLYVQQVNRLEQGIRKWAINNTSELPKDDSGIVFFSVDRVSRGSKYHFFCNSNK